MRTRNYQLSYAELVKIMFETFLFKDDCFVKIDLIIMIIIRRKITFISKGTHFTKE